ncbi:MAG: hypothetical protein HY918_02175 [Candidatus Doudnabacteria bacterium]|nr:hypothetical protein [Candidatus Doudnabacteria bacterium]
MSDKNQTISWTAAEFRHYPKSAGWYVTLISVAILVIAFFIIVESDIFAAITLGIIAVLVIFFSLQTPKIVNIELNDKGVKFDNLFFPYKQMKYFWVVNNDRHRTVNFHTTALINNTVILELENQDGDQVRNLLLKYLPEHHETDETPIQRLMHKLKF